MGCRNADSGRTHVGMSAMKLGDCVVTHGIKKLHPFREHGKLSVISYSHDGSRLHAGNPFTRDIDRNLGHEIVGRFIGHGTWNHTRRVNGKMNEQLGTERLNRLYLSVKRGTMDSVTFGEREVFAANTDH